MPPFKLALAAAVLGFLGTVASAAAAPAQTPTPRERSTTASERSGASAARQEVLDTARIIADQMRREKRGDMTSLLSKAFKAAYDAVPTDEDNLGVTILGGGYDVPDRVVRVSEPRYDSASDPPKASVTATLHYTNADAPVPSFDRSIVVVFVGEGGRWKIDDVHILDPHGNRTGREVGLKRAFEGLRLSQAGAPHGERQSSASPTGR